MKLTPEQQTVIDLFGKGEDVAVTAGAGTGKTSTLIEAAKNTKLSGVYVAFNKAVQLEATEKFGGNVTAMTAHGMAMKAGGHRYRHRLGAKRMKTVAIVEKLDVPDVTVWFEDSRDGAKQFDAEFIAGLVMRTVENFCRSDARDIDGSHVPRVDGLDAENQWSHNQQVAGVVAPIARKAWWKDLSKFDGDLRFSHDHYLKAFQLSESPDKMGVGFVMVDEAQDLSPCMVDVFKRMHDKGTQIVAVGDSNQAIYKWRGAVDAMGMIETAEQAELSHCWRFGPEIAVPVNAMLDRLGSDLRLVGRGSQGKVGQCPDARAVLARSNARLVVDAINAMKNDVRFAIVGNMPTEVSRFAESARNLMAGRKAFHPELAWAQSWGEVLAYVEQDMLGADLAAMVTIIEDHGVDPVLDSMRAARDEGSADVVFSTMHASKGREWPEVRLCGDYRRKEDGTPDLDRAEFRLYYVAASRAMSTLDIDECLDVFYPKPTPTMKVK